METTVLQRACFQLQRLSCGDRRGPHAGPLSAEEGGSGSKLSHIPTLPGMSCVTLSELLNLSVPWSPPRLLKG